MTDPLARLVYPTRQQPATASDNVITEGVVHHVDSGGLWFTIPEWDDGRFVYGPAPWPRAAVDPTTPTTSTASSHSHTVTVTPPPTPPTMGQRCLVVFLGSGIERPWVIGVWDG